MKDIIARTEAGEVADLREVGDVNRRTELYEIGVAATATAALITLLWAIESTGGPM